MLKAIIFKLNYRKEYLCLYLKPTALSNSPMYVGSKVKYLQVQQIKSNIKLYSL